MTAGGFENVRLLEQLATRYVARLRCADDLQLEAIRVAEEMFEQSELLFSDRQVIVQLIAGELSEGQRPSWFWTTIETLSRFAKFHE